ncbi:redox-sensitive transcriptional activator SoxR [Ilumatobacter nonamiensis]|uniref:redox-sensitive transcriptional activator SoxR n=1 Tax=Ilumatobacter nonamiensis TaxID=467093 RepID=UPI000347CD22|nr:redox-sensitive transcriptional activator SoxR [Ilumatobacter nonamiensis]
MVEVNTSPETASGNARVFTIGELAGRAGLATSAIRFYEEHGLITSERNESGHRRFRADALRRVSFIKVAQRVGLSLSEIRDALDTLPASRTPNRRDWAKLARGWKPLIDERIALLEAMREKLDGCIGCGCLSLDTCEIYNLDDEAGQLGSGPRWLLGDRSSVD